jgi:hypothetical protein
MGISREKNSVLEGSGVVSVSAESVVSAPGKPGAGRGTDPATLYREPEHRIADPGSER